VDLHYYRSERYGRSVHKVKREPQAGPASCLSKSASKRTEASGEGVEWPETETDGTTRGEVTEGLPGSKSVAREEGDMRNLGEPESSRRTNYESQAGREAQRQEAQTEETQEVGSVRSSLRQGKTPEASQGTDKQTKPAQATGPVRMTEKGWQTFLQAITEKARKDRHHRFGDLYRWLNCDVLRLCFQQLRKNAASGVDRVTYQDYERNLEANLTALVQRLKEKRYRARLVRRKYIPKGPGKMRPLGIPALEDKLLQVAVTQILCAIYEVDFLKCSYGYRPGLGPHDAIGALTDELYRGNYNFLVEADIKGFFDNIQHEALMQMLNQRIGDGALLRMIRKWLKAGILEEDGKVIHPQTGTPQGGVISPVLANVYLHYVLDQWFEEVVQNRNQGGSKLFRYADDFVACFEYRHEAEAFEAALKDRLAQFGLELAPDKTKTLRFGRNGGDHNGRFDFLGFEFYWEADRKGRPIVKRRTSNKKWLGSVQRMTEWIKANRHQKVRKLMKTLNSKLRGTWNYYGIIGNGRRLSQFAYVTNRLLFKWLNRRSQKRSYTWDSYNRLLKRFQVPQPRIVEKPQVKMPCQLDLGLFQRIAESAVVLPVL
jgi:RNA-directed DNA polymerase